ncbi:MAG: hypothetical protein LCH60_07000 [Actinobacteria bacterium]|nr:hypothetical protein [Actinomycetota bacterium]
MRGRDFTVELITDLTAFATDKAVSGLEDLASAADNSGRSLDKLDPRKAARTLDGLGEDAKAASRKVSDAYDSMADAARQSASRMDASADRAKRSMRDVKGEAQDTAREMFASFRDTGDLADAAQELTANAGSLFGPVGLAISGALAVAFSQFLADSEAAKQSMADLTSELVESNGRISASFIDRKIAEEAANDPTGIVQLRAEVEAAGVSWRDYMRAKHGDAEATARLYAESDRLSAAVDAAAGSARASDPAFMALKNTSEQYTAAIGQITPQLDAARAATAAYGAVSASSSNQVLSLRTEINEARAAAANPIVAKVSVQGPPPGALAAIRQNMTAALGTIVVPVAAGTSPYKNTADNSRYRG